MVHPQHFTAPEEMAHEWYPVVTRAETLDSPETGAGVSRLSTSPVPRDPRRPNPQHFADPATMAHVDDIAAEMVVTPLPAGSPTGCGTSENARAPDNVDS